MKEEEKGGKTGRETETRGFVGIVAAHPRDDRQARDRGNDPRGRLRVPMDRVTLRRRRETRGGGTRRTFDGDRSPSRCGNPG